MNPSFRRHAAHALLAFSLLLNVALIGYLGYSGGLRRLYVRMDLAEPPVERAAFQKALEVRYRKLPNTPAEVVFAGDSHIGGGPWAEFFSEVHNRGIGGDRTADVLRRIDEVTESKPRKVFLLLGTNDVSMGVPDAQYLRNYRALIERIRADSPETKVNVIAMLPVNSTFKQQWAFGNAKVKQINEQLKRLVDTFPGVGFIDLTPYLVDDQGELRREFTGDGSHINDDGYLAIREPLGRYVFGDGSVGGTGTGPKP